jgi:hypothetical protein
VTATASIQKTRCGFQDRERNALAYAVSLPQDTIEPVEVLIHDFRRARAMCISGCGSKVAIFIGLLLDRLAGILRVSLLLYG